LLLALAAGVSSTADLIRATSACFIAVYVLALASAVRILHGRVRTAAAVALALVTVVAVFSSKFLLVPAAAALVSLGLRRLVRPSTAGASRRPYEDPLAGDPPSSPDGRTSPN
jgi:amino acid efflux transporter